MSAMPSSKKERTHEQIVRAAATAIRGSGYAGVSVAEIMREAGLTHGGFYAHFDSRDAMLAEALDAAAGESRVGMEAVARNAAEGEEIEALVAWYLSDAHVAAPDAGCAVAALAAETPRQTAEVRGVMTRVVKGMVGFVRRIGGGGKSAASRDGALASVSTLVGALVLARAVDDPALAASIRRAAAKSAVASARWT